MQIDSEGLNGGVHVQMEFDGGGTLQVNACSGVNKEQSLAFANHLTTSLCIPQQQMGISRSSGRGIC